MMSPTTSGGRSEKLDIGMVQSLDCTRTYDVELVEIGIDIC